MLRHLTLSQSLGLVQLASEKHTLVRSKIKVYIFADYYCPGVFARSVLTQASLRLKLSVAPFCVTLLIFCIKYLSLSNLDILAAFTGFILIYRMSQKSWKFKKLRI